MKKLANHRNKATKTQKNHTFKILQGEVSQNQNCILKYKIIVTHYFDSETMTLQFDEFFIVKNLYKFRKGHLDRSQDLVL